MKAPAALAALLVLAACGETEVSYTEADAADCAAAEGGRLTIENAWVRAQSDATGMSAAYFTLCNGGTAPVTVEGLSTPAAGVVELHETTRDANGVVSMAPTGPITLAPGEAVLFEPGGKHAMLMNLPAPIAEGATTTLSLDLAGGGKISAEATAKSAVEAAGHAH
jgi:hypothetical protein